MMSTKFYQNLKKNKFPVIIDKSNQEKIAATIFINKTYDELLTK